MSRVGLTILMLAVLTTAASGQTEPPRTISTNGEATVYVSPDEVVVTMGVRSFDPSLDKARSDNADLSAKLIAAIKAMGIEDKHVQTQDVTYSLSYVPPSDTRIAGYVAQRQYAVTLKDASRLEEFVTTVLKNGANQLLGVEYRTTELRKHRDQARKLAINAARDKARDLAGELECDLGKPRTIGEGSLGYWGGYYVGRWGSSGWASQNAVQVAPGDGGSGGETMPLGQIAIRAQVSVTFDLVPR
jgi:uncharacterized protein YggE